MTKGHGWGIAAAAAALTAVACAQGQGGFPGGPGGQGRRGGMGGPGGGVQEDRPVVKQFDANGDGWLNAEERAKAREFVKANPARRGGPGGMGPGGMRGPRGGQGQPGGPPDGGPGGFPGGPGGFRGGPMGGPGGGRNREPAKPGASVKPGDVKPVSEGKGLYDPAVLRTVFIDFEEKDWEKELQDFEGTDVDVASTVTVDGKAYRNVGLRFRGNSSLHMVPDGYKKSFNVDFGLADKKQRLLGYKTFNLLNANGDPTLMRSALYSRVAGETIPIAKANLVKVVVNGENWGVFGNVQQVDKIFLKERFGDDAGIRWKTPGSPGGRASLAYLGDDPAPYKRIYDIKTKDEKEAAEGWKALTELTKTLNETPAAELPAKIEPILDVKGALWFLALENALVNSDGYWVRSSDYNLYRDSKGRFHVFPHDFNETFLPEGGGPGMGGPGGPGGGFPGGPPDFDDMGGFGPPPGGFGPPSGGPEGRGGRGGSNLGPAPLVNEKDPSKPLASKLLAVPKYRAMYLRNVAQIATEWLDWGRVRPIVAGYDALIDAEVKADTKKLESYEAYRIGTGLTTATAQAAEEGPRFGPRAPSLRAFVEGRRKMLLADPAVKAVMPAPKGKAGRT